MEQGVLGAALISTAAVGRIRETLTRDDFYIEAHRKLFDAITTLADRGEPVDTLSLSEEMRGRGQLDAIGGNPYLSALWESVPTAAHVDWYARHVFDQGVLREIVRSSQHFLSAAHEQNGTVDAFVQEYWLAADRIAHRHRRSRGFSGMTAAELVREQFAPLRWVLPGIFAEGFSILAGKGKMGKSWMLYQLAVAVALGGVALGSTPVEQGRVLYLALEDTKRRLKSRLETILMGGPAPEKLHLFTRWPRMREGGQRDLIAWFRQYSDTRLVVIDTFAKIRSVSDRPGNAYDEDYRAMSEVKEVADNHGASIIAAHHFNKLKPTDDWVDSVSGSIGISGAADGIVGFFRERDSSDAVLKITGRDIEDERDRALTYSPKPLWLLRGHAEGYVEDRDLARVLVLMEEHGPLRPSDVADALNWKRETAKSKMYRWAEKGLLRSGSKGFYSAAPRSVDENERNLQPMQPATDATCNRLQVASVADFIENGGENAEETLSPVASVADFAQNGPSVASVAKTLDFGAELELPPGEDPDSEVADLRRRLFRLAGARGWPKRQVGHASIQAGVEEWAAVCRCWAPRYIEEALSVLGPAEALDTQPESEPAEASDDA